MAWSILEMIALPESTRWTAAIGPDPALFKDAYAGPFDIVGKIGAQSGDATPGIVVEPTFDAGLIQNDFLFDFYFRIWVFPLRLELRNPRTNVDIPFAIWNAYPFKNTLTSIGGTGTDGLALDLDAPSQFREIEYRTVNLQITPAAPLSIEAVFEFIFQNGKGLFTFIADRASVLSIIPDVPVNETWQWLTDVQVATDGTEQRAGLRAVPRRKMSTKLVALTEEEIRENVKKALFDFGNQVVIPYFQYGTTTTLDAVSGSTDLAFDPAKTDVREGEYLFVMTKTAQELVKIETLGIAGCTIDAPITIDVPRGSIVAPAFGSVVDNRAAIARYAVNDVADIQVDSTNSQARANFKRPNSTATINTLDGYPILDKRPLANSNVEDQYDQGYERFDYQTGSIEQITRWLFTRTEGARQYLIHRAQQPETLDFWRDFLDASRGMLNPFLVPTYRKDLFIADRPDDASITLLIQGSDYASLFWPMLPYRRLYLWTDAGAYPVTVDAVSLTEDGNTLATLSAALPSGDEYRNISFISFLLKCRLASDEVTLEHHGLETILNMSIRTIPE